MVSGRVAGGELVGASGGVENEKGGILDRRMELEGLV